MGVSRPTPRGMLRGLAGGSPGPYPGGYVEGSGQGEGGLQAHTQGEVGGSGWGVSRPRTWGMDPSIHWGSPPPPSRQPLLRAVCILLECILVIYYVYISEYIWVFAKFFHYSKRARTCHPATSCVRDQNATTVPARHMWKTWSLNWAQFMLQWFIRFPKFAEFSEFLFYLGKPPLRIYREVSRTISLH